MTVYTDSEYKCHLVNDGSMTAFETDFFDGKCPEFIEGYRCVPEGEVWTRADGTQFKGVMIAPWVDYAQLAIYNRIHQRMLDRQQDMNDALEAIYGGDTGE